MSSLFEETIWKGKAGDLNAFAATQRGPEEEYKDVGSIGEELCTYQLGDLG